MSHRDDLRAFQARLATRLQEARSTGVAAAWLAVEAGADKYLLPLGHAGEIFPWTAPQPVPYTAPWFLGVANFRGGLYGVVDLARLGPGGPRAGGNPAPRASARLVAFNEALEVNAAILIDRLVGLRAADAFKSARAPAADAPPWHSHVFIDGAGGQWQEINLQLLSEQPEFLSIDAQGA